MEARRLLLLLPLLPWRRRWRNPGLLPLLLLLLLLRLLLLLLLLLLPWPLLLLPEGAISRW